MRGFFDRGNDGPGIGVYRVLSPEEDRKRAWDRSERPLPLWQWQEVQEVLPESRSGLGRRTSLPAVEDDVDRASNAVLALLRQGSLDEAEQAALALSRDYPEVNDGFDRLGMVCEARGEPARAAEMYQCALDFTLDQDGHDEELRDNDNYYRETIALGSEPSPPSERGTSACPGRGSLQAGLFATVNGSRNRREPTAPTPYALT